MEIKEGSFTVGSGIVILLDERGECRRFVWFTTKAPTAIPGGRVDPLCGSGTRSRDVTALVDFRVECHALLDTHGRLNHDEVSLLLLSKVLHTFQ